MKTSNKLKINSGRWEVVQSNEKDYWDNVRSNMAKEGGKKIKDCWDRYLKIMYDHVDINAKMRILEIGPGPVGIINYITEGEKYAIDPLMSYFESNFKSSNNVKWLEGIGEAIPFGNNYFDVVVSTNALDHSLDPVKFLEEAKRVLKERGFLFLTVNCHQRFFKKYRELKEFFKKGDKFHPYSFSIRDVKNLIETARLQIIFVQRGFGGVGTCLVDGSHKQDSLLSKRVYKFYKKNGIIKMIDTGLNMALNFLGKKITGKESEVDFIFIAVNKTKQQ